VLRLLGPLNKLLRWLLKFVGLLLNLLEVFKVIPQQPSLIWSSFFATLALFSLNKVCKTTVVFQPSILICGKLLSKTLRPIHLNLVIFETVRSHHSNSINWHLVRILRMVLMHLNHGWRHQRMHLLRRHLRHLLDQLWRLRSLSQRNLHVWLVLNTTWRLERHLCRIILG